MMNYRMNRTITVINISFGIQSKFGLESSAIKWTNIKLIFKHKIEHRRFHLITYCKIKYCMKEDYIVFSMINQIISCFGYTYVSSYIISGSMQFSNTRNILNTFTCSLNDNTYPSLNTTECPITVTSMYLHFLTKQYRMFISINECFSHSK